MLRETRSVRSFADTSQRFVVARTDFGQQYSGLYFSRLVAQRTRILDTAARRWAKDVANKPPFRNRLIDVTLNHVCYIIGTVFVSMPTKPSILDEVTKEQWVAAPPQNSRFFSQNDSFILEDESGRMKLVGDIFKRELITTGMIVAVLGSEDQSGDFHVIDICFPELAIQKPIPPPANSEDAYVVFVSGMEFGGPKSSDIRYELLSDMIVGEIGSKSRNIVRLVICGDSIAIPDSESTKTVKNKFGSDEAVYNPEPITACDEWMSTLAGSIEINMMCGPQDLCSRLLPQQKMHEPMFQKASQYSSFRSATNPFEFEIDQVQCIATSGQNIDSIFQHADFDSRLEIAAQTLKCGHLAPLAPDALFCHPFKGNDPFILERRPHLYVIGNQPKFDTSLIEANRDDGTVEKTRVVLLPRFSETGTIALVNIRTLEASMLLFNGEYLA